MSKKVIPASMAQGYWNGQGHGSIAQKLLAHGMKTNGLRQLTTLLYEEWIAQEAGALAAVRLRTTGVNDLMSRGLRFDLGNQLGETVLRTQTMSTMEAAEMAMSPRTKGEKDRLVFDQGYLPLPITFKDFELDIRELNISRKMDRSLDVLQAEEAGTLVGELIEKTLFQGASTYTYGGGIIYGYQDFPKRTTVSFSGANWATAAGSVVLTDVRAMTAALHTDRHHGPYVLYIPSAYQSPLNADFKANSDITIRERILKDPDVEDVKVADYLSADNVVMVEMNARTVRMVVGLQPQMVSWEEMGGMDLQFKMLAIMVPQLRADYNDRSGIAHLS